MVASFRKWKQKQKLLEDSNNNKSPPSSLEREDERPPTDEEVMKTPWQVLEELGGNEDSGCVNQGGTHVAGVGSVGGGGGGGGSMVVESSVIGREVVLGKKRKPSELKDLPSGKPTCPVCHREFSTWKGAFGHMRKHPDRQYRGFFKPPVFDSTSTTLHHSSLQGDSEKSGGEEKSEEEGSAPTTSSRGLIFDLNQPMGSFESAEENNIVAEPRNLGFDLNQMPSAHDDEDK